MQRSPFPPGSGGVRNWSDFAQGALSFPKIISGRIGDVDRPGRE
jgi:hypothetical protein